MRHRIRATLGRKIVYSSLIVLAASAVGCDGIISVGAWPSYTIDDSSSGADGVRLLDVNGDGLLDVATPWEQGGVVRAALHPGEAAVRSSWQAVTVGSVDSPEDAVFADLDGDGQVDVVSACEGDTKNVYVHWAPSSDSYLQSSAWQTALIGASEGVAQWMFVEPADVDGDGDTDLIAGAKGDNAAVGWFEAPADPRVMSAWTWHRITGAGWIMSLVAQDMDDDGDLDIVVSDRKGDSKGVFWLENNNQAQSWQTHRIGGSDRQVMFLTVTDLDQNGSTDILAATYSKTLIWFRPTENPDIWFSFPINLPDSAGIGKGVAVGDINLDGRQDIVFSCEKADGKQGVMWMSYMLQPSDPFWSAYAISGTAGSKFDLVQLNDVDGDGDLDVMTCEESAGLGVVWYENPQR